MCEREREIERFKVDISYFKTSFKVDVYTSCPDSSQITEKELTPLLKFFFKKKNFGD